VRKTGGYVLNVPENTTRFGAGVEGRLVRHLFGFLIAVALILGVFATANALSPLDPNANIPWDEDAVQPGNQATFAGVGAIQSAFSNARRQEELQFGLPANSLGNLALPGQAAWNALSLAQRALLIVNSERVARAGINYGAGPVLGLPLEGVEGNINTLSQAYTDYMLANDFWAHNAPAGGPPPFAGTTPFSRIDNDPVIGNGAGTGGAACHQFISSAENLGALASSPGTTIPMRSMALSTTMRRPPGDTAIWCCCRISPQRVARGSPTTGALPRVKVFWVSATAVSPTVPIPISIRWRSRYSRSSCS
jgi:hypothetical protein